jgi:hypothetical protein
MKEPHLHRWVLLKDTVIFQLKLGMDAIRDLLLSPVSIICALIDFFRGHNIHQSAFYKLMALGHKTDQWINLFGDHKRVDNQFHSGNPNEKINSERGTQGNVDRLFDQVEALLKEQHNKGGLTASAKLSIDRYLDKIVNREPSSSEQTKNQQQENDISKER